MRIYRPPPLPFFFSSVGFLFTPTRPNPPDSSISPQKFPIRRNREYRGRIFWNATSFAFSAKAVISCLTGRSCQRKTTLANLPECHFVSYFCRRCFLFPPRGETDRENKQGTEQPTGRTRRSATPSVFFANVFFAA